MCHWREHMEATTGYKGGACDNLETLFANVPSPSGGFIFIWLTFLNVYLYICQLFELVFQLFWSSAGRKLLDYVTIFGISNHTVLELENLNNQQVWHLHSHIHKCFFTASGVAAPEPGTEDAETLCDIPGLLALTLLQGRWTWKLLDSIKWYVCHDKGVSKEHRCYA